MAGEIASAVIALSGAALGSLTTLAVQWRSGVVEHRKLAHETRGRVNALAVTVFREYLAVTKAVERLSELREAGAIPGDEETFAATNKMWLAVQEVQVFCPAAVYGPAQHFVDSLQFVVWHRPHEPVSDYLASPRNELFAVAGPIFREADMLARGPVPIL